MATANWLCVNAQVHKWILHEFIGSSGGSVGTGGVGYPHPTHPLTPPVPVKLVKKKEDQIHVTSLGDIFYRVVWSTTVLTESCCSELTTTV